MLSVNTNSHCCFQKQSAFRPKIIMTLRTSNLGRNYLVLKTKKECPDIFELDGMVISTLVL